MTSGDGADLRNECRTRATIPIALVVHARVPARCGMCQIYNATAVTITSRQYGFAGGCSGPEERCKDDANYLLQARHRQRIRHAETSTCEHHQRMPPFPFPVKLRDASELNHRLGLLLHQKMFASIRTMSNRIWRFEYKACRVEVFVGKKGMHWTWAFVVNGTEAKTSGRECCKTAALALHAAKAEACRFIDQKH